MTGIPFLFMIIGVPPGVEHFVSVLLRCSLWYETTALVRVLTSYWAPRFSASIKIKRAQTYLTTPTLSTIYNILRHVDN